MLRFCLQSLFTEYGWQFFRRVALPHPLRTARALLTCSLLNFSSKMAEIPGDKAVVKNQSNRFIVGVGFCLKPIDPPCPSGRFNHECHYLEHLEDSSTGPIPNCCERCAIREIGINALKASAAFYIMTSAKDILLDLFIPALKDKRFESGIFLLCRYSFQPYAFGLLASGIAGRLFALERGDCADYRTWLQADRGVKAEQTLVSTEHRQHIGDMLQNMAEGQIPPREFYKRNNVFMPSNYALSNQVF